MEKQPEIQFDDNFGVDFIIYIMENNFINIENTLDKNGMLESMSITYSNSFPEHLEAFVRDNTIIKCS